MSSSPSPFSLSQATRDDIPAIVAVARAAFKSDPVFHLMKRDCDEEEIHACDVRSYGRTFSDPGITFIKVVDVETGKIVSFAKWRYPHTIDTTVPPPEKPKDPVPRGFKEALQEDFVAKLAVSRKKYWDNSKDYFLNILCTDPAYQRRGLGRLILNHGIAIADGEGAQMYLESSVIARPLYLSLGWVEVGEFDLELEKFGGEGPETIKLMVRAPRGAEARGE